MTLTFWSMLALISVPAFLFWLALASWLRRSAPELVFYDNEDDATHPDDLIRDDIAEMPYYVDRRTSAAALDEAARRVGNNDDSQAITAMYFVVLNEWGF